MPVPIRCDVAIAGAGLAGSLVALALARTHPDLDVRLVDAGDRAGGNHIWSFFAGDIAPADRWIVAPLVCHAWPSYRVAFAGHRRRLAAAYHSIESERLDAVLRATLPEQALLFGRPIADLTPTAILLADGGRIEAGGVIDARGAGDLSALDLGWQKFVGQELSLAQPHDAPEPVVMDASIEQIDGYRFVYTLPFAPRRLFVEDTYYADSATVDAERSRALIARYAAAKGWQVARVTREEIGSLPVAMGGDFARYWRAGGRDVAKVGMRAALFHPLTGYSLPDAVRTASRIAAMSRFDAAALHEATWRQASEAWRSRSFYRLLTRMLFRAAEPGERHRVLDRFYRLDAALISRFYAGRSTMTDKARILAGKPPVPVGRALAVLREDRA